MTQQQWFCDGCKDRNAPGTVLHLTLWYAYYSIRLLGIKDGEITSGIIKPGHRSVISLKGAAV